MSAPAKKLADLGKKWSQAPGWTQALPRVVSSATLAPRAEPLAQQFEKPADLGAEFRRQYEIWRRDHPARAGDLSEALPPIEDRAFDRKLILRIAGIGGAAALTSFYLVGVMPSLNNGGFQPAPLDPAPVKLAASATKTARLEVPPMPVAVLPVAAPSWPMLETSNTESASAAGESIDAPTTAPKPVAALNADEIDLMRKRGEEFIATGDLASARLVLERAARAHDARAAFALASTYDPAVLDELRVYGASGDIELAIMWYERAKLYGSKDAGKRLLALAGRM